MYRLELEPGTSYIPNKLEALPLEPACSRFECHECEAKPLVTKKQPSVW
jgi:hypothetical protein